MHINVHPDYHPYLTHMKLDLKFISLAILLLLLGFGGGYYLQTMPGQEYLNPDLTLEVDNQCDLNVTACRRALNGAGSIKFAIEPRPIFGVSPLVFSLDAQSLDVSRAMLDLSGTVMNMGSYRFDFKRSAEGRWVAEGVLPVCIRNEMEWRAEVWLDTQQQGLVKVPFIFTAAKQ